MTDDEPSCGAEIAASAEVPERLAALLAHVAVNLDAHARWVGTETDVARREHDAMRSVSREYENVAEAALRLARRMREAGALEPAPHDPGRLDRAELTRWMEEKVRLQRELGTLLLHHAETAEKALRVMRGE